MINSTKYTMSRKFQTLQNFVKAIPLAEWSTLVSAIYFKNLRLPLETSSYIISTLSSKQISRRVHIKHYWHHFLSRSRETQVLQYMLIDILMQLKWSKKSKKFAENVLFRVCKSVQCIFAKNKTGSTGYNNTTHF